MKKLACLMMGIAMTTMALAEKFSATGTVEVFFPPYEDATSAIVEAIHQAREEILLQSYVFTSYPIARALIVAKKKGVKVSVLMDKESATTTNRDILQLLLRENVEVKLEKNYVIAHNKIILIDGASESPVVITGSFNFTVAAQAYNSENLLILRGNIPLAHAYVANWREHYLESEAVKRSSDITP